MRERLGQRIESATFKQRQQIFSLLQIECTYDDEAGTVLVTGVFGSQPLTLKADDSIDDRGLQLT
jgi:hypothetical protein